MIANLHIIAISRRIYCAILPWKSFLPLLWIGIFSSRQWLRILCRIFRNFNRQSSNQEENENWYCGISPIFCNTNLRLRPTGNPTPLLGPAKFNSIISTLPKHLLSLNCSFISMRHYHHFQFKRPTVTLQLFPKCCIKKEEDTKVKFRIILYQFGRRIFIKKNTTKCCVMTSCRAYKQLAPIYYCFP